VAWLHGIFPGVPSWAVQIAAAAVLVARLSMMRPVPQDVEVEERRRG